MSDAPDYDELVAQNKRLWQIIDNLIYIIGGDINGTYTGLLRGSEENDREFYFPEDKDAKEGGV
jgi:hypothetical protein